MNRGPGEGDVPLFLVKNSLEGRGSVGLKGIQYLKEKPTKGLPWESSYLKKGNRGHSSVRLSRPVPRDKKGARRELKKFPPGFVGLVKRPGELRAACFYSIRKTGGFGVGLGPKT